MTTLEIGNVSKEKAARVKEVLDGKTYMNFRVDYGIMPGGCPVSISTDYQATEKEISELVIYALVQDL